MNARLDLEPHRWRSDPPLEDIDVTRRRRRRDDRDKLWIGLVGMLAVTIILFWVYFR